MKQSKQHVLQIFAVTLLFPIFVVLLAEYIQAGSVAELISFVWHKPGIIVFDILLTMLFFLTTLFLLRSVWISAAVSGFVYYTLSCIEFIKYSVSGSHLVLTDFFMAGSVGDITGFAKPEFSLKLILALIFLLAIIFISFKTKLKLNMRFSRRIILSVLCVFISSLLVLPSNALEKTYNFLNFDLKPATNSFNTNERFTNNGFLGFLFQNATETLADRVTIPTGYSENLINNILILGDSDKKPDNEKPNVIFIMSESFADLRELKNADIPEDIYSSYDKALNRGLSGKCVVPTFGGYTGRTEFELLFGLPVNSLNNPAIPHYLLRDNEKPLTFAKYFKSLGYTTTYIHPFSRTFYERGKIYAKYGFDNMYFSDNFTVKATPFRKYIDDRAAFEQIKFELQNDASPSYIFTTTMQNHQPYSEEGLKQDELGYYLDGIKNSSEALNDFISWLDNYNEKVILVFVGDHFPFFTPGSGVYDKFGINESNINDLYSQKYFIYSNYEKLDSNITREKVSAFYLPYLVSELAGVTKSSFINTMLQEKEETPIYSMSTTLNRNPILDALTYDRVLGNGYSEN